MVTQQQKMTAQAIVNIFETGKAVGDYGRVTVAAGDAGHLTYGRSQTTLASGNLYRLIQDYCAAKGARFADGLSPFLDRLWTRDLNLDRNRALRSLLRQAGGDPVMREAQDRFFDSAYWDPAAQACAEIGVASALGHAVVYDSHIHGSWKRIRDRANARHGTAASIGEHAWVGSYVRERRAWLAGHSNALLRKTVYRMDAFIVLIEAGNWELALPFAVRGVVLDKESLGDAAETAGS